MRKVVIALALVGLMAAPASAGLANLNQIPGTFSAPAAMPDGSEVIGIESLQPGEGIPYTLGAEAYDNWPSILGGAGSGGVFGISLGTFAFFRWGFQPSQWGDDIHGIIGNQLTHVHYGFLDIAGGTQPHTSMHSIKIYDMSPPSTTHGTVTATVFKGALLASVPVTYTLANTGNAFFTATITFPTINLPNSSVWIKFGNDQAQTFWLTGGFPTIAPNSSHDGLTRTIKDYPTTAGYYTYNTWFPLSYLTTTNGTPLAANISVALGIPEPMTIGLLAIGGLACLRRRRARAA